MVRIQSHEDVMTFKQQIQDRHSNLSDLPSACLKLFRISEDDVQESLDQMDGGTALTGRQKIFECFADSPVLENYCVVVQLSSPESINKRRAVARRPVMDARGPINEGDLIMVARNNFLRDRPKKSPSSSGQPSSFHNLQGNLNTRIPCGRPRNNEETIPATLLHPVFGQFLDGCQTEEVKAEDNEFIQKLANVMSDLHKDESVRIKEVNKVLETYGLNFNLGVKVKGTDYVMDGEMSTNDYRYVIAEFKNETAAAASEPYMQAVTYYLESTSQQALQTTGSALPCFLFLLFGPYIVFAGAVWNLRPIVQVLSTPLALHYHSTDTDSQINAARHMAAFRNAVRSLGEYYEGPQPGPATTPMLFPYRTYFTSLDGSEKKKIFRYKQQGKDERKLIFFGALIGESGSEVPICIKFVRRYSREAHEHCAKLGFAPTLRGCETIPGGWFMVVMDDLQGYDTLDDVPNLPESVFSEIESKLATLHAAGFAHGDIRDTNIMVKREDRTTFMIIDFDWAGKINVVKYPPYVNFVDIKRPGSARDGMPILKADDEWMLKQIISQRSK
ncbi:hypothetical protein F5J12DRAFT_855433 [Pisolithus orientalis]|uniref:uncharacterized protein n=1 Tax=Pisolithus orientalis TaxID=936130 RepID=UPI0022241FB0|nr:uncharacterized protein F5J12DRAFT_855433 [Pisolithus orientalis]KAI5995839.1 hypothetical protein F5J12DRAFT_855433 [Pisolithus orientalis]